MFSVWGKREERFVVVYDIIYDAITGYPQFLIYDDGEWRRVSAKHYEPYEAEDDTGDFHDEAEGKPGSWYEED